MINNNEDFEVKRFKDMPWVEKKEYLRHFIIIPAIVFGAGLFFMLAFAFTLIHW